MTHQLAVELACQYNGEIINADAMQMYRGLPIITNKISPEEQRSIPHHLLGNIGLDEDTWTVGVFKREASKIIREIRSRGRLPIVVGGTHYYTNSLLFEDILVEGDGVAEDSTSMPDNAVQYPILDGPTDAILAKLREVDPAMADRWHPNDRRKSRRSLEIFLTSGRRASEIYAEQEQKKATKTAIPNKRESAPWQALLLWVYSKPDILKARLDKRVDKMVDRGLMAETAEIYDRLQERLQSGENVDLSKGIWQSIGFKQFEPYLKGLKTGEDPLELEKLRKAGLESMKTATRHYAKSQIRWITFKTLPLLKQEDMLKQLYVLDSTDIDHWNEHVAQKGLELTRQFLHGEDMPDPTGTSDTARGVLSSKIEAASSSQATPCRRRCEVCNMTVLTEELWDKHIRGRSHRKMVRHAKRTALVPFERPSNDRALLPIEKPDNEGNDGQDMLDERSSTTATPEPA